MVKNKDKEGKYIEKTSLSLVTLVYRVFRNLLLKKKSETDEKPDVIIEYFIRTLKPLLQTERSHSASNLIQLIIGHIPKLENSLESIINDNFSFKIKLREWCKCKPKVSKIETVYSILLDPNMPIVDSLRIHFKKVRN